MKSTCKKVEIFVRKKKVEKTSEIYWYIYYFLAFAASNLFQFIVLLSTSPHLICYILLWY